MSRGCRVIRSWGRGPGFTFTRAMFAGGGFLSVRHGRVRSIYGIRLEQSWNGAGQAGWRQRHGPSHGSRWRAGIVSGWWSGARSTAANRPSALGAVRVGPGMLADVDAEDCQLPCLSAGCCRPLRVAVRSSEKNLSVWTNSCGRLLEARYSSTGDPHHVRAPFHQKGGDKRGTAAKRRLRWPGLIDLPDEGKAVMEDGGADAPYCAEKPTIHEIDQNYHHGTHPLSAV
jgi:hypothetical protein